MTTTSAANWYEALRPWHFVLCDEASQVPTPMALMMGALGKKAIFAGDPDPLAPVVQCPHKNVINILESTAFETVAAAEIAELNEQSRMAAPICDAVSKTFDLAP